MSGGRFDYRQCEIRSIAEAIERELEKQGEEKPKEELWMDEEYYLKHPEERFNYTHPEDIQQEFREAINLLRKAYVYASRIDWLLSGDDSEDCFRRRLKEDLSQLNQTK